MVDAARRLRSLADSDAPGEQGAATPATGTSDSLGVSTLRFTYNEKYVSGSDCDVPSYVCTIPLPGECGSLATRAYSTALLCADAPAYLTITATDVFLDVSWQIGCTSVQSNYNMTCGGAVLYDVQLNAWATAMQGCDAAGLSAFAAAVCGL